VSFLEEHTYSLPNEYQVIISAIAAVIIEGGLSSLIKKKIGDADLVDPRGY
jgi:hypothetical protein